MACPRNTVGKLRNTHLERVVARNGFESKLILINTLGQQTGILLTPALYYIECSAASCRAQGTRNDASGGSASRGRTMAPRKNEPADRRGPSDESDRCCLTGDAVCSDKHSYEHSHSPKQHKQRGRCRVGARNTGADRMSIGRGGPRSRSPRRAGFLLRDSDTVQS